MSGSSPTNGNDTLFGSSGNDFIDLLGGVIGIWALEAMIPSWVAMARIRFMAMRVMIPSLAVMVMIGFSARLAMTR